MNGLTAGDKVRLDATVVEKNPSRHRVLVEIAGDHFLLSVPRNIVHPVSEERAP